MIQMTILSLALLAAPAPLQNDGHDHDHGAAAKAAPAVQQPTEFAPQTTCPVSGEELEDRDLWVDYQGHRVYLCCKKCNKKFQAFPDRYLFEMYQQGVAPENVQETCPVSGDDLEDRDNFVQYLNLRIYTCCKKCKRKVAKDPATWLDELEGRHPQEKCAVRGGKVKEEDSFLVEGVRVRQCCAGCEKKWRADPAKYFHELEEQKVVLEADPGTCLLHPGATDAGRDWFVTVGPRRYWFHSLDELTRFFANPTKYLPDLAANAGRAKEHAGEHGESEEAGHDGHGDHDHGR